MDIRAVDITNYIQARSQEIMHFTKQLDQKFIQSNKTPYQSVPKHMRRRAMSHNRYRIPIRLRQKMSKDIELQENAQDRVKCRKSIRKSKLIMQSYIRRSRKYKWLETHLWHAKRMKMIEYFGYKIALNPNDKSSRACYRFSRKDCCIYDKSYYQMACISGLEDNIKTYLQNYITKNSLQKIFNQKRISGNYSIFDVKIYEEINDIQVGNLIGVAQFLWQGQEEQNKKLICIFHPGMKEQIQESFSKNQIQKEQLNIDIKYIADNYNIFELFGPETMKKMYQLSQNLQFQNENMKEILELFNIINDPCQYPQEAIFHLNSKGKISPKLITPPMGFFQGTLEKEDIEDEQYYQKQEQMNNKINNLLVKLANPNDMISQLNKQNSCQIWDKIYNYNDKLYQQRFKVTNRSRYTHKKKNKMDKQQKKQFIIHQQQVGRKQQLKDDKKKYKELEEQGIDIDKQKEEILLEEQRQKEQDELERLQEIEKQENIRQSLKKECEFQIMVIIKQQNKQNQFGGVQLIIPQNMGHIIWKIFNFLCCKTIGLKDYRLVQFEQNVKVFPQDYPTTKTYQKVVNEKSQELVRKYIRRPPGNRVNFEKLKSPFPFKSDWDYLLNDYFKIQEEKDQSMEIEQDTLDQNTIIPIQQEDLQEIQIDMVQRGVPFENSYVCLPSKEDLELYQSLSAQKSPISYIHKETTSKDTNTTKANEEQKDNTQNCLAQSMSRKIIGFTTSGGFSLSNGKGIGRGYILKYVLNQKQNQSFLALIRNTKSQFYFLANIKLV